MERGERKRDIVCFRGAGEAGNFRRGSEDAAEFVVEFQARCFFPYAGAARRVGKDTAVLMAIAVQFKALQHQSVGDELERDSHESRAQPDFEG
jgi:hypothetical protein